MNSDSQLPSSNQTWQWKINHLVRCFVPVNPSFSWWMLVDLPMFSYMLVYFPMVFIYMRFFHISTYFLQSSYDFAMVFPIVFPIDMSNSLWFFPIFLYFLWFSSDFPRRSHIFPGFPHVIFPRFPRDFPGFLHLLPRLLWPGGPGAAGHLGPQPGAHRRGSRCHGGDPGDARDAHR